VALFEHRSEVARSEGRRAAQYGRPGRRGDGRLQYFIVWLEIGREGWRCGGRGS